jgi:hypothetical protein
MSEKKDNFLKRLTQSTKYIVQGVKPDTWFSPIQPIQPMAQQAEGRQYDYTPGLNIQIQPRAEEVHGFKELRLLADNCDILRIIIETRKDQIKKLKYDFKINNKNNKDVIYDSRTEELNNFFSSPDKQHTFEEWLGALLEDLFVIDAATLYPRMTNGGKLFSLELIDGSTIKKVIDSNGRTPIDDTSPAYQQILKGVPAVDYTYRELIYKPRNIRTNKLYGYSHVEQILVTVNTQIRKSLQQLSYYSEGNTPNLIFSTPNEWNPDQIRKFQLYWDEINQNQSKSLAKFVPSGVQPFNTKPEPLKNEFDEWLARIICYTFSINPQGFVKEMNRATSETSKEIAEEEGLLPIMQWVKGLIDSIIINYFGYTDIKFEWNLDLETDPLVKAQIDKIYVEAGIKKINEIRADLSLDPLSDEELTQDTTVVPNDVKSIVDDNSKKAYSVDLKKKRYY